MEFRRLRLRRVLAVGVAPLRDIIVLHAIDAGAVPPVRRGELADVADPAPAERRGHQLNDDAALPAGRIRSEEHTSDLQSLMRISYAVFCLQKTKHAQSLLPLT